VGPIIHIVDDDKSYRTSLGRLIEASGFRIACYGSGEEILAHLPSPEAGCILIDLAMPGMNGLDLQERLADKAPLLPIIFLTGSGDVPSTVRALKAGAEDFIEKSASSQTLLKAIEGALDRYRKRRTGHDRTQAAQAIVARLTAREIQVLDLFVVGWRNKQIAFELGISERTVKAHRRSVMEKLKVRSLAEAVSIARDRASVGSS
jgi:FixJ family two-component response regulator